MSDAIATDTVGRRHIDYLAWMLRVALAVLFVIEGLDKFGHRRLWIRVFAVIGLGQWFRYFTGALEVACATLLLVPKATPVAVATLFATMVGALLAHGLVMGFGPQTMLVVGIMAALVTIYARRGMVPPVEHSR